MTETETKKTYRQWLWMCLTEDKPNAVPLPSERVITTHTLERFYKLLIGDDPQQDFYEDGLP